MLDCAKLPPLETRKQFWARKELQARAVPGQFPEILLVRIKTFEKTS